MIIIHVKPIALLTQPYVLLEAVDEWHVAGRSIQNMHIITFKINTHVHVHMELVSHMTMISCIQ